MATFKHISSKNADYSAAEVYLTFEHDEFTMRATLDENGRLIPREDYRISTLNCGNWVQSELPKRRKNLRPRSEPCRSLKTVWLNWTDCLSIFMRIWSTENCPKLVFRCYLMIMSRSRKT